MYSLEFQFDTKPEIIRFRDMDFSDPEILKCSRNKYRRCPVIVTLADAKVTAVDIQKMLEAGINAAKFKMSFSTKGDKLRLMSKIDKAAMACCEKYLIDDWPVATCVELKTCIVKTGIIEGSQDQITIEENSEVILTVNIKEYNKCNKKQIFVDNPYLTSDIKVGTEISIASDEIILKCTKIIDNISIKCKVIKGGRLTNLCNVCGRGVKHTRPNITKKDLQLIEFAMDYEADVIILNYVRNSHTVLIAKQFIGHKVKRPLIFSGICTQEGIENIDDILKESDGIILSREFLTYEIEASRQFLLPRIQKWLTAKCIQVGKPLFLSGGILNEVLRNGVLVDSEISDITNALLDGISGFILKDSNNVDMITKAVKEINQICNIVEPVISNENLFWRIVDEIKIPTNAAEAAMISCAIAANMTQAKLIIIPTVSGKTLQNLHWLRPSCGIMAVCTNYRIIRMLQTYRGVIPLLYKGRQHKKWQNTIEARIEFAIDHAVHRTWLQYGDTYVTLERSSDTSCYCDVVGIWKVDMLKKARVECQQQDTEEITSQ